MDQNFGLEISHRNHSLLSEKGSYMAGCFSVASSNKKKQPKMGPHWFGKKNKIQSIFSGLSAGDINLPFWFTAVLSNSKLPNTSTRGRYVLLVALKFKMTVQLLKLLVFCWELLDAKQVLVFFGYKLES